MILICCDWLELLITSRCPTVLLLQTAIASQVERPHRTSSPYFLTAKVSESIEMEL